MTVTEQRVRVGGLELALWSQGPEQGDPVVLLHGLAGDHATWDTVAARLARRHRVVAPDQRGCGASDRAPDYSFALMADDLLALVDAMGWSRVVLVGHSMGGVVALLTALRRPGLVSRLVLEEAPPPVPLDRPDLPEPAEPPPYDWALVNRIRAELRSPDLAAWAGLERLRMPVLLLLGGPTSALPQPEMASLAARLPDCRFVTVPVGHGIHSAAPERFCELLEDFLG